MGVRLRCIKCGSIIESLSRHDLRKCSCGKISIDGGDDYCKMSGDPNDILVAQEDGSFKVLTAILSEEIEEISEWDSTLLDGLEEWRSADILEFPRD